MDDKDYHKKYAESILESARKNTRVYRPLTEDELKLTLEEIEYFRKIENEEEVKLVTLDFMGYKVTMSEKSVPFYWRDKIIKDGE